MRCEATGNRERERDLESSKQSRDVERFCSSSSPSKHSRLVSTKEAHEVVLESRKVSYFWRKGEREDRSNDRSSWLDEEDAKKANKQERESEAKACGVTRKGVESVQVRVKYRERRRKGERKEEERPPRRELN